jgi:hypothetical protein
MQPVTVIIILKIKNMSVIKNSIGFLMISAVLFSCKKTTTDDMIGDPGVKFFTNITSPGNAPQNSISYSAVNVPNPLPGFGLSNLSVSIPSVIKFPVFATSPVSADVTVQAQLDTSLVAKYNAAYNTSYLPFPAGILKTDNLAAHILKGTSTSADSISIPTDLLTVNTLTGTAYMAPVKLTSVSGTGVGDITANTTTQVAYIVLNIEQRRIKFLATAADALGALITPRTAWTAAYTVASSNIPTTTGSIFDGSTTTFNKWIASPVQVDVNMQATQNLTGIRLFTSNAAATVPTQVDVYLSNDGINFDKIGSPLKANLTYASSYNYILFYKAIPAKYIRLVLYYVVSTSTQNYRLVEFDAYAN